MRDISLIFNEFKVAPLWFMCNNRPCSSQCIAEKKTKQTKTKNKKKKKKEGPCVWLRVSREPRLAGFFVSQVGGREERFCRFDYRVSSQFVVQSQGIFPVGCANPTKSMLWLIIIMLIAELRGSDWLVVNVMGWDGEFLLFGLGCLETECRHLLSNSVRY